MQKILAVVKFNQGEAFVLSEPVSLTWESHANKTTLLGRDGHFIDCLFYDSPSKGFYAFGGRKFDITLKDGEVINCYGQYWSGISKKAIEVIGEPIVSVTACFIGDLKRCYVFSGFSGTRAGIAKLRSEYKGIVYPYYEYESMFITSNKYRQKGKRKLLKKYKRLNRTKRVLISK